MGTITTIFTAWLVGLLGALALLQVGAAVAAISGSMDAALGLLKVFLFEGIVFGGLVVPMYYEIGPTELLVRSGLLRYHVPLDGIESVRPSHNPLSSPAMSLDRLRIDYRVKGHKRVILISPADKSGFLDQLALAAPGLVREGDSLRRRTPTA